MPTVDSMPTTIDLKKLVGIALCTVAYIFFAKLGSFAAVAGGNISPIWPATGLMIALVILYGRWLAIAAFFGTLLFVTSNGTPFLGAVGASTGNMLEPLLAGFLVQQFIGKKKFMASWEDVVKFFIFAGIIPTLICALIGVLSIVAVSTLTLNQFTPLLINWWLGDFMGAVIFAPAILIMADDKLLSTKFNQEFIVLSCLLVVVAVLVFLVFYESLAWRSEYLIFPMVIWISLRKEYLGAAISVLLMTIIVIVSASLGYGPFEVKNDPSNIPVLQFYLIVLSFSCFVTAATENHRKQALLTVSSLNAELEDKVKVKTNELQNLVHQLKKSKYLTEVSNEQLKEAKRLADKASESKSEFLANMSHEIRTPMNGVVGMLHTLGEESLTSKQQRLVGLAKVSADSLLTIIDDILSFSKIESGQLVIESVEFDLVKLLDDLTAIMSMQYQGKDVRLTKDIQLDNYRWFVGDPTRIRQVFSNLINNAYKFTHQGEISISVAMVDSHEGVILKCRVTDTGIGISNSKLSDLFSSFTQADASTTRKYGGTGLGLAIAKQLCILMGGDIQVTSEEGKGSCFEFSINSEIANVTDRALAKSDDFVENSNAVNTEFSPNEMSIRQNIRILVVEDNMINQIVVVEAINKLNCNVDVAQNGEEAINKLLAADKTQNYGLILMDCHMPIMDGYQASQAIRAGKAGEFYQDIPIIALTANAMYGDDQKCFDSGMTDYLTKPIAFDVLSSKIQQYVNLK